MQTINDGTHDSLPAAVPASSRPDRARVPVTMPRQTDGKMRLDGSGAAKGQPEYPVDERGRVQGASQLETTKSKRVMANDRVYFRIRKEKRRCQEDRRKHSRLRGQDKSAHIALWVGRCLFSDLAFAGAMYGEISQCALRRGNRNFHRVFREMAKRWVPPNVRQGSRPSGALQKPFSIQMDWSEGPPYASYM